MNIFTDFTRRNKIKYFFDYFDKDAKILDVGCADMWVKKLIVSKGWTNYVGLDLVPSADIVGDIRDWKKIGLKRESFDVILAFEMMEHVLCVDELFSLLKPNGFLAITTPLPHMDWLCFLLEKLGVNQKRTSPHCNLFYFKNLKVFTPIHSKIYGMIVQWGIFKKTTK